MKDKCFELISEFLLFWNWVFSVSRWTQLWFSSSSHSKCTKKVFFYQHCKYDC